MSHPARDKRESGATTFLTRYVAAGSVAVRSIAPLTIMQPSGERITALLMPLMEAQPPLISRPGLAIEVTFAAPNVESAIETGRRVAHRFALATIATPGWLEPPRLDLAYALDGPGPPRERGLPEARMLAPRWEGHSTTPTTTSRQTSNVCGTSKTSYAG